MPAAHLQALLPEQVAQHAAAGERIVQMQLVDAPHQPQIFVRDRTRLIVDRAAADLQHLGLLLDGKVVLGVDHRFALSSPALVSAPSKKSFSSVSSPILACSVFRSTAAVAGSALASPPKTPAAPSRSWLFHCVIWLAMYVKLLRQLGKCLFSLDGGQSHLRLECRCVVPARTSAHLLSSSQPF